MNRHGFDHLIPVLPSTLPGCRQDASCAACGLEPCQQAVRTHEAIALIHAGARAPLIKQLTGLPEKYVKRLYRMVTGKSSPRGMAPYSDAWFLENERRMLHATVVWQIYRQLQPMQRSLPRTLLDVLDLYHFHVRDPLLDITYVATAIQLMTTRLWHEKSCQNCALIFVAPSDDPMRTICPGCKLHQRFRCRHCGAPLTPSHQGGRPRNSCQQCCSSKQH